MANVTWSRWMSLMSGKLILSYKLKEVTNSYVLYCFEHQKVVNISATRCAIEMGFGSKCSILNWQMIYPEKSNLNIANMWLIPLDCVTNILTSFRTLSWKKMKHNSQTAMEHASLSNIEFDPQHTEINCSRYRILDDSFSHQIGGYINIYAVSYYIHFYRVFSFFCS